MVEDLGQRFVCKTDADAWQIQVQSPLGGLDGSLPHTFLVRLQSFGGRHDPIRAAEARQLKRRDGHRWAVGIAHKLAMTEKPQS